MTGTSLNETKLIDAIIGGWDTPLEILLIIMALDYMTGVIAAFRNKEVNSAVGYKGLLKKTTIFIIIILAAQLDKMMNTNNNLFRNSTAIFFVSNDALSILENAGLMGIHLPKYIRNAFVKLKAHAAESCDERVCKIDDEEIIKNQKDKQQKINKK